MRSFDSRATAGTAPKAYVGLFGDNSLAVLDTASSQVLKTIPIPTGPHGLVMTPDGKRVYASSDGDPGRGIALGPIRSTGVRVISVERRKKRVGVLPVAAPAFLLSWFFEEVPVRSTRSRVSSGFG